MTLQLNTPVLLVDDMRLMRRVLVDMLQSLGYDDVDVVATAGEALANVKRRCYGLVVCDWNLAGATGLELLVVMRDSQAHANVPFIVITAYNDQAKVNTDIEHIVAVGDLALAGAPILGRFVGVRSGHRLNNMVLRALFADSANWCWATSIEIKASFVKAPVETQLVSAAI